MPVCIPDRVRATLVGNEFIDRALGSLVRIRPPSARLAAGSVLGV